MELSLTAFGPFSGHSIDLSEGQEGLHLIYGDNAAGKSSTLRAISGLLYGIPVRTADNHVHAYADLRIQATLKKRDGHRLAFVRKKAQKRSLLDDDGEVLDPEVLAPFLGGVSKERFEAAFGIDHDGLVAGGRAILEGRGEIGTLLVESGLGGSELRRTRERLEKGAEALFARGASKRKINAGINRFEEISRRVRSLVLPPERWQEVATAHAEALSERASVVEAREAERLELAHIRRLIRTLPIVTQRSTTLASLTSYEQVPDLPADARENRLAAVKMRDAARVTVERTAASMAELVRDTEKLKVDPTLLAYDAQVGNAMGQVEWIRKLEVAAPAAQQTAMELERERAQLCAALAIEAETDFASVDGRLLDALEALADRAADATARLTIIEDARIEAASVLESVVRRLDAFGADDGLPALKAALVRASKDRGLEAQINTSELEIDRLNDELERACEALPLFGSDSTALDRIARPMLETIVRFEEEVFRLEREAEQVAERLRTLVETEGRLVRDRDEFDGQGDVPTEETLRSARKSRDRAWLSVREHWLKRGEPQTTLDLFEADNGFLSAYEEHVRTADEVADRLRREADRVASRSVIESELKGVSKKLRAARREQNDAATKLEEFDARWRAAWEDSGLTPLSPTEMRAWHGRVETVLERHAVREALVRDRAVAQRCLTKHRASLARLMDIDGEAPYVEILDQGAQRVQDAEARAHERKALEERRLEAERKYAVEEKRRAAEQERLALADVEAKTLSDQLNCPVTAQQARTVAAGLRRLLQVAVEKERTEAESKQAQQQILSFSREVDAIAVAFGVETGSRPPILVLNEIAAALAAAKSKHQALQAVTEQIERLRAEHEAAKIFQTEHTEKLRAMCERAGAKDESDLECVEERALQKRRLFERLSEIDDQLIAAGDGLALEVLFEDCRNQQIPALRMRETAVETQLGRSEEALSALDQKIGGLSRTLAEMDGGDEAAVAAEEAASVAAEVKESVSQYVQFRLASSVLRRHIDRYRQDNEGPLVGHAARLFTRMTLGEFEKLEVVLDDNDLPLIHGVRASGQRVDVSGMSEGTRDQLYLSLRLAALHRRLDLQGQEPLPFIVDDILVGFDDRRAAAALEVLGEFAKRTQVLFFTHHHRLCELATPLSDVYVHEL